jgi:hypothetical protein
VNTLAAGFLERQNTMTRFLLAGAAALGMMTGAVMAQTQTSTSSTQTTTTTTAPPVTISNSTLTGSAVTADDVKTSTVGSGFGDSSGNATKTTISTTTYPLTDLVTTTKKTTQVENGVAKETVSTTQAYPASPNRMEPIVTTTTDTKVVK